MNRKNPHIKRSVAKTLLIIIGVIIALIMTMGSPLFTSENSLLNTNLYEPNPVTELKGDEGNSSDPGYHSGARLLYFFSKNLPYLNNK